jgi:hypothetical protein
MTREIRLQDIRDVVEFNGFWAERPNQARLIYEEDPNTGLWQLILTSSESGRQWRLGAYLDGHEGRAVLYEIPLRYRYGRYVEDDPDYDVTNDVIVHNIGEFEIRIPDEWRPKVVLRVLAVCGPGHPLMEPVWLGALPDGRYFALDCASGVYYFNRLDELENWVREQECPEGHERPTIHWWEWHIINNGQKAYSDYVQPSPEEVIEALRRHLL